VRWCSGRVKGLLLPPYCQATKEWSGIGPGCPGAGPQTWRCSQNLWMWPFETWFGRRGAVGLAVGLDDLRGLFQHE